jgi:hypothetical protein
MAALGMQLMRSENSDPFVLSSKAIIVGLIAQCLLNSVMLGVLGFMVWTFASMCLAQMDYVERSSEELERPMANTAESIAA